MAKKTEANSIVPPGLIGLFLHTLDADGVIRYQGHIVGLQDDFALVQLFSFMDGRPTVIVSIPKDDIHNQNKTRLYATNEIMIAEYCAYSKRSERQPAPAAST